MKKKTITKIAGFFFFFPFAVPLLPPQPTLYWRIKTQQVKLWYFILTQFFFSWFLFCLCCFLILTLLVARFNIFSFLRTRWLAVFKGTCGLLIPQNFIRSVFQCWVSIAGPAILPLFLFYTNNSSGSSRFNCDMKVKVTSTLPLDDTGLAYNQ